MFVSIFSMSETFFKILIILFLSAIAMSGTESEVTQKASQSYTKIIGMDLYYLLAYQIHLVQGTII